jgi:hypothetical protein
MLLLLLLAVAALHATRCCRACCCSSLLGLPVVAGGPVCQLAGLLLLLGLQQPGQLGLQVCLQLVQGQQQQLLAPVSRAQLLVQPQISGVL